MDHAIKITLDLNEKSVCTVRTAGGEEKALLTARLTNTPIADEIKNGLENCKAKITGDYCALILTSYGGQWGYTLVWDYVRDKLVHLTHTPFAVDCAIDGPTAAVMYLVQYWGHPADLWYSVAPLELVDAGFEPDTVSLDMPVDGSVTGSGDCEISAEKGRLFFRAGAGKKEIQLKHDK